MEIPNLQPNNQLEASLQRPALSHNMVVAIVGVIVLILAILTVLLGFGPTPANPSSNLAGAATAVQNTFSNTSVEANSAIVIDLKTMEVLYAKNPDAQLPLASLTKVPLVLAVSEVLAPDATLKIPRELRSAMGAPLFKKGESWRVQSIIDATLITSSNDGAEFLSETAENAMHTKYPLSPSEGSILWRMNAIAHELGLSQTYFLNVSGLDISTTLAGAYGSARDVATLFAYVSEHNSSLFAGTARGGALLTSENGTEITARNTNESESVIPGLIMGKTGYTDLAGGNLAVVFDVGIGHPVVAVVLGSTPEARFTDIQTLVDTTRTAITSM